MSPPSILLSEALGIGQGSSSIEADSDISSGHSHARIAPMLRHTHSLGIEAADSFESLVRAWYVQSTVLAQCCWHDAASRTHRRR